MEIQNLLAQPGVGAISFDCCVFGSIKKESMTALLSGLDDKPDGLARWCGRHPTCRYTGHWRWPRHFGNASWIGLGYSATDLTAQVARLLTSDASAMIHNRLDFNSTFPPTFPHQRDARRVSVPSGARSCRRPTFQPDLPRRARHSRDRHIHRQNERHAWLCACTERQRRSSTCRHPYHLCC